MATLLLGIALGIWLMASPAVLHYTGTAGISALVGGPIAASVSWIALSEVTRSVRRFNVAPGLWLIVAGLILPQPSWARINSIAVGLLLGFVGLWPTRIKGRFGGGWKALVGPPGPTKQPGREVGGNA
jgi:hypothetical protein